MNIGKVLLGVLGGIAMGGLIGTLFAPEKGAVTRNKISKTRKGQVNKLRNRINEFLESINGKTNLLKDHPEDVAKKGKAKAEKLTE